MYQDDDDLIERVSDDDDDDEDVDDDHGAHHGADDDDDDAMDEGDGAPRSRSEVPADDGEPPLEGYARYVRVYVVMCCGLDVCCALFIFLLALLIWWKANDI